VDLIGLFKDVAHEYVYVACSQAQVRHLLDPAIRIAKARIFHEKCSLFLFSAVGVTDISGFIPAEGIFSDACTMIANALKRADL
jgi:hypothetical protein